MYSTAQAVGEFSAVKRLIPKIHINTIKAQLNAPARI